MGGTDVNGQLKLAALRYRSGNDFWPGPLTVNPGSGDYNPLFPVGDNVKQIIIKWIDFLKTQKGFIDNDPLFSKNQIEVRDFSFFCTGLSKEHWQQTTQARQIFKQTFANAGIKCYNPYSFRRTIAHLAEQTCTTAEQFKAWSQNLGHDNVNTTFSSYGMLSVDRQGEVIKGGGKKENTNGLDKDKLIELIKNMN
jgi:integrase